MWTEGGYALSFPFIRTVTPFGDLLGEEVPQAIEAAAYQAPLCKVPVITGLPVSFIKIRP